MKRMVIPVLLILGVCVVAVADDESDSGSGVPTTVEGGSGRMKDGGKELGEGFKGIGRGIKDVFTGHESATHFKKSKKIGNGFVDIGKGAAGIGRGVGRGFKKGATGDGGNDAEVEGHTSTEPMRPHEKIQEEPLPQ